MSVHANPFGGKRRSKKDFVRRNLTGRRKRAEAQAMGRNGRAQTRGQ